MVFLSQGLDLFISESAVPGRVRHVVSSQYVCAYSIKQLLDQDKTKTNGHYIKFSLTGININFYMCF